MHLIIFAAVFVLSGYASFAESVALETPHKNGPELSQEPTSITIINDRIKIPLTRCCQHNQLYRTGLGYCRPNTVDVRRVAILPIYSTDNVSAAPTMRNFDGDDLEISVGVTKCRDGYIGKYSGQFKIFDDGTIDIKHQIFQPHEFCISETIDMQKTDFVVRFCIRDPCDGINCARKCCPLGTAINKSSRMCQPNQEAASLLTNVMFKDQSGFYTVKLDAYTMMDGVTPECRYNDGRQAFNQSNFYLLPDGRMKVPSFRCQNERVTKEYCIDHFVHDDNTVSNHCVYINIYGYFAYLYESYFNI